jgi:hypothetical protein
MAGVGLYARKKRSFSSRNGDRELRPASLRGLPPSHGLPSSEIPCRSYGRGGGRRQWGAGSQPCHRAAVERVREPERITSLDEEVVARLPQSGAEVVAATRYPVSALISAAAFAAR